MVDVVTFFTKQMKVLQNEDQEAGGGGTQGGQADLHQRVDAISISSCAGSGIGHTTLVPFAFLGRTFKERYDAIFGCWTFYFITNLYKAQRTS